MLESPESLIAVLPVLAGLALVDSLSMGTLAVPVWLLMAPGRLRPGRVVVYLVAIAAFYFLVGLALLAGFNLLLPAEGVDGSDPVLRSVLFVVGAAMLILSFVIDPGGEKGREKKRRGGSGRLSAWRAKAMDATGGEGGAARTGFGGLLGLALGAGLLELATMVPYLAAVGILSGSGVPTGLSVVLLAGYCVVMVLPAVVLLGARMMAGGRAQGLLQGIDGWFNRNGGTAVAWILGIVGVLLMVHNLNHVQELIPFLGAGIVR